jgi:hypothetical protein
MVIVGAGLRPPPVGGGIGDGADSSHLAIIRHGPCSCTGEARMTGFRAEWLALRGKLRPARAQSDCAQCVAASFKPRPAISVVDLACGTGSSVRALSSHVAVPQRWERRQ